MASVFKATESDLLLLIDPQNDFCPGGALAVAGGDEIMPVVNALVGAFGNVILTQDWHPPGHSSFATSHAGRQPFETILAPYGEQTLWPDHCVQGTPGAAFHPALQVGKAQAIIRKGFRPTIDSYSAFYENDRRSATGLTGLLMERGIRRLFLAGLATDFCVAFSALDARAKDFEVLLIEDACRAIDLAGSLAAAKARLAGAGVVFTQSAALL